MRGAAPLVSAPALLQVDTDSFTLLAPRAGSYTVALRFTPYWAIARGAVASRAPGGWTRVAARAPGVLRVAIRFSLARVFAHGPVHLSARPRCT